MTLLSIAVILFLVEIFYFFVANRLNIIDNPNERSSHSRITLRGGGVIFPIAVLLYSLFYGLAYPLFLVGLLLISVVSFWDDLRPLPNKIRLSIHFTSVLLLFVQWTVWYVVEDGGWGAGWAGLERSVSRLPTQWEFPSNDPLLVLPLLIVCAGIVNAYNFMDGINGITGGYSLAVLGVLAWINAFQEEFVDPNLLAVVLVSLLVFNFFNFRTRAVCFAGDVGSVSIAFVIVFILGALAVQTNDPLWIVLLAVYGVDSVLTIIHRLLRRENIFQAHRMHVYQLLANELKIPHLAVSTLYAALQIVIGIGYLVCRPLGTVAAWTYCLAVFVVLGLAYLEIKRRWFYLHTAVPSP